MVARVSLRIKKETNFLGRCHILCIICIEIPVNVLNLALVSTRASAERSTKVNPQGNINQQNVRAASDCDGTRRERHLIPFYWREEAAPTTFW
jgi:hypothetical protein